MSLSTARRAVGTLAVAAAIFLAGCQSDVMKGYIGQPLESVIIDYGPPTSVIELGRGQRAYQWSKISTNVAGSTSGEYRDTRRGTRYEEYTTPGYVEQQECFYTFYATRSEGRWYITNFRKPKLECE